MGEGRRAGELRAEDGLTQSLLAFNGASLISSPERWLRPSPPASISRAALCQRIYDKLIAEGKPRRAARTLLGQAQELPFLPHQHRACLTMDLRSGCQRGAEGRCPGEPATPALSLH